MICYNEYLVGYPQIIRYDFHHPSEYFGLIKARVYQPRGLYFPILLYRTTQGKLVFSLFVAPALRKIIIGACVRQDSVLYINTNSLIYAMMKGGEQALLLGNYLGDLTKKLGGDTIQKFARSKCYTYQAKDHKKTMMHVKGISRTPEACQRVNFDNIGD